MAHFRKLRLSAAFFVLIFCAAAWLQAPVCRAELLEMADTDLSAVYATGFSTFDLTGNVARIDFHNLTTSTWTEINSLKTGYYTKGTAGWDNDWTTVSLGSSTTDLLVANGLFIEAGFTNVTDAGTRTLDYLRIGTPDLQGKISGKFDKLSGSISGTPYSRQSLNGGTTLTTINSNGGFYLSLERTGANEGFRFVWANASISP